MSPRTLIVGVGNEWRGDDAFGHHVVRYLREHIFPSPLPTGIETIEHSGEGTSLMDAWQGYENVILVDCVEAGLPPGAFFQFDASGDRLPSRLLRGSTHQFGVAEAIEMARTMGQLPARVLIVGVQGASYEHGASLSEPVARAVPDVARRVEKMVGV